MMMMMRVLLLSLISLVVSSLSLRDNDDVILKPLEGKKGDDVVMFFAQGASIPPSSYVPLMSLLQQQVDYPLWIGIPQCLDNSCAVPNTLSNGIKRVQTTMEKEGMPVKPKHTFFAGHSLGGAMLPDYIIKEQVNSTTGIILLGAFLTRKYRTGNTTDGIPQVVFPVPSLTIGGELDGLSRITRITEALHTQVSMSSSPSLAMQYMPVTVIEGMNHMQFASGVPPTFVADHDIQAEITEANAHQLVVNDMSMFMTSLTTTPTSSLVSRVEESIKFVQPIVEAFLMEGYFQYLPPCLCETADEYGGLEYGTCVSSASCQGGCPWTTEVSQKVMGKYDGLTIESTDSIHFLEEEHPSCHLPHIHKSATMNNSNNGNPGDEDTPPLCDKPEGCVLTVTTVTEPSYDNSGEVDVWRLHFSLDELDSGFLPISAKELKTKMKSRQSIFQAAGLKNVSFTATDAPVAQGGSSNLCGDINQASIDWAISKVSEKTADRYKRVGQQLIIGPDQSTCPAGPCFIWKSLQYDKDDDANIVTVKSVWFGSENHNNYPCGEDKKLPCDAGFHYCKILSPARVVEWIYVDGLKNNYSTKNNQR